MSAKSTLVLALVVAAAAGLAGAWRAANRAADMTAKTATLRTQRGALDREAEALAARMTAAENERTKLQSTLEELRRAKPAAPAVKKAAPQPPNPAELMAKDPQLQLKGREAQRVTIARQYGPMFRRLALTPEQVQRFTELITRRTEQQQDLNAVARERGLAPNAPEIAALQKSAGEEFERDQTALLGPEGYAQFRDYEQTIELRAIVGQFAGASVVSGVPLSAEQADRLVSVLSAARASEAEAGRASGVIRASSLDWAKADAQAAQILTPAQLALFQSIEPIGGGPSRWWARLDQEIAAAKKTSGAEVNRVLNTAGKKGPNG